MSACDKMDSLIQYGDDITDRLSSNQLSEMSFPDANNNEDYDNGVASVKGDKYSLRPRSMRRVTELASNKHQRNDFETSKSNRSLKPKQKPAPLSKYRRKTANARERNRMREINQAFETLRQVIPQMACSQSPGANEKLTKITTLRLAMKYIASLSAALNGTENISDPLSDCSDLDYLLLESDGESLPLSDHSLLASPDFPETSLSPVDFDDPSLPALLQTDFTEHALEPSDFGDFLLT